MKLLIFAISILLSASTLAAPPQQWVTDPPNGTTYRHRHACPGECLPLVRNGVIVDLDTHSLGEAQEPDGTFTKHEARDCANEAACIAEIADMSCRAYASLPVYAPKEGGGFEAYCPMEGTRTVRRLIPDAAKVMARNARLAGEAQLDTDIEAARARIDAAIADWGSVTTPQQQKQVLRDLIQVLMRK